MQTKDGKGGHVSRPLKDCVRRIGLRGVNKMMVNDFASRKGNREHLTSRISLRCESEIDCRDSRGGSQSKCV